MMNCNKCGKNMQGEKGVVVGMLIQNYETDNKFMAAQFGKYAGRQRFMFCYECVIDAMMGVA